MRIDSLDILKGIGIIRVVVGHMIGNQLYIRPWIYAFHMPLFFMVSGYCFNIAKHPKWLSFAMSRVWSLLVPCALYTVISLVVSPEYICEGKYYELKTLLPGALWFLPILFIVEVLGYNIASYKANIKIIIMLICAVLATSFHCLELPLTYRLVQIPMCLFILFKWKLIEKVYHC